MTEITHRTIQTNGINMHIAEAGSGPLVLLVHGFPESWYSWRHQLPALAEAGYHAVAPDVRGYGRTDAPQPIEAYSMRNMVADMAGVLDALGEETAVIVGHDWGAPIAWNSAVLRPERYRAVAGLSVPFLQRSPLPPTQLFKLAFKENFFYILYFQEPGVAEAELEADPRRSMRLFLFAASGDAPQDPLTWQKPKTSTFLAGMPEPERLPSWLTEADLDYFTAEFARTGFRGGLNRYRNMDRDWEEIPELTGAKVTQPAIFIAGERDGVIAMNPAGVTAMKETVSNLRKTLLLPGAGHWTQQERPAEVNAALIEFLKGL
jgi:pimeloyl-ACP methyl ester carboxylesterase